MGTENNLFCSGTLIDGVPLKSKKDRQTDRQDTVNLEIFNQAMFQNYFLHGSLNLLFITFICSFVLR